MDLTWLEDFEALAESGSFSRAAEARHVTQPAFSRRIRALEDWAGARLFKRGAQPIALTEAGSRLRPLLADIVRKMGDARDAAGAAAAGSLRFAATHALSFSFVPGWLRSLEPRLPSLPIHLISDDLDSCERLMLARRAEFLLCHHHPAAPGRLDVATFTAKTIGHDRLLLLSAPGPDGGPQHLANDPSAPRLGYGLGSGLARIVAATAPLGSPRPVFTSQHAAALQTMARDGRGLAWLPESLVLGDLADGCLVQAADADIPLAIRIVRPAVGGSRAARLFWQSLTDPAA